MRVYELVTEARMYGESGKLWQYQLSLDGRLVSAPGKKFGTQHEAKKAGIDAAREHSTQLPTRNVQEQPVLVVDGG